MKKTFRAVVLSALAVGVLSVAAKADPFADFDQYLTNSRIVAESRLGYFAEDFGGLLGGADFNSGRALGFPGFDVGIAATIQAKPNANNVLLNNAGVKAFGIPLLQASVGLPVIGADITLRGTSLAGLSIIGGGLRYGVLKSGTVTKFIPDVSVSVFYDVITYDYFKGSHMSFDAAASFDIPVIKPFVGIGLDRTSLEVKDVIAAVDGVKADSAKLRYTLGVKFSPLPLAYIYGAYSMLHGQTGYQAGLGVRF